MKKDLHPKYNNELKITCSCGNSFITGSTLMEESVSVDICSKCHPFYTGKQRGASRAGRVDKFNKKYGFDKKNA